MLISLFQFILLLTKTFITLTNNKREMWNNKVFIFIMKIIPILKKSRLSFCKQTNCSEI